jgi:ppGpp synthetase/RelA/SpoT-type nucleotidyltranferase
VTRGKRPEARVNRGPGRPPAIDLQNFDAFKGHPLVAPLVERYRRDATLAQYAVARLLEDLEELNDRYLEEEDRVAFTAVEGRVKEENSFLMKLLRDCRTLTQARGVSQATLAAAYAGIKDLAGVRFSCPYYDEVVPAVNELVRPALAAIGYGTDLRGEAAYQDKDFLDEGDSLGYRSYHFYVRVPTVIDIYGGVEPCLCEVQARTELQQVWAHKSHDLLYKPTEGWGHRDERVVELMRQVSNNLRAVDEYLVDIRRRTRGEEG